jgi:hypothetical protein
MKQQSIAEILRRAQLLPTLGLRAKFLHGHIASEQGNNLHKTSVRIRELQIALHNVQMRRLKRAA